MGGIQIGMHLVFTDAGWPGEDKKPVHLRLVSSGNILILGRSGKGLADESPGESHNSRFVR
jgi:hypothetical protein